MLTLYIYLDLRSGRCSLYIHLDLRSGRCSLSIYLYISGAGDAHYLSMYRSQEREMLKLIAAKDALAGGAAAGDDAVGELEDNLYEANSKLEEEQERAT